MKEEKILNYAKGVLLNMPKDWLRLTTHRLDIYNEELAKTEFIQQFELLFEKNNFEESALNQLPTAYDYIRLGHPLSTVLEWCIARINNLDPELVISFSSKTIPLLSILRKNHFEGKQTLIAFTEELSFDFDTIREIYGYNFETKKVTSENEITAFNGSTIYVSNTDDMGMYDMSSQIDFYVKLYDHLGSILLVNGQDRSSYISEIQHVRRRETIAMTPTNCHTAMKLLVENSVQEKSSNIADKYLIIQDTIKAITGTETKALLGSSGLSIQYAIMMGLIDEAINQYPGKEIKIVVPPNCYGGTNDQARRVAACLSNVEVLDLPVDGDNDMVQSIDAVLSNVAKMDAVPYIIAEIPTNPRVEVPDLAMLKEVLSKKRKTKDGSYAIDPVFILDQTFCPNVQFLAEDGILSSVRSISYVSGSKFPSGGKCTAGYCVANKRGAALMENIEKHLQVCDNEATVYQITTLAEQLPSMNQRIQAAYENTREFVNHIEKVLPQAKINFVSEELAAQGFTPSVFSLDLPTKGETVEERESHKRELNHQLIELMINTIPTESKYCVSYGQLKGCYWTIPATSTQGTTKEADKDYIARVALSGNMDLELHKSVFSKFAEEI